MKPLIRFCVFPLLAAYAIQSTALSLAPEEFDASRKMACMLAQQSLGQISEDQYGERVHTILDGFDEAERDNILAQAVGYYRRTPVFQNSRYCRKVDGQAGTIRIQQHLFQ